jgi:hypothetical protein
MTAERVPALGQPADDEPPERDPDFSAEHDTTAVDRNITAGRQHDGEPESPDGWSGLEDDGPP